MDPNLEPRRDCQTIAYRLNCLEFPWDTTRSLELALFRTFCSPRIGGLLHATGEFGRRAQKRYDDTDLILNEIIEHGFESERGRRAIERMNAIHGRFRIRNEDFLYVLSTFVFEPIRWNARFGWRPMTEVERLGWFWYWIGFGSRMGIQDLPQDYNAFERYNRAYEAELFRFTEASRSVGLATREMFAAWFPRPLRPFVRLAIPALLDEPVRQAFGFAPAPAIVTRTVEAALRLRALLLRFLPRRRTPRLRTQLRSRSYPGGYRIEGLGPPPES